MNRETKNNSIALLYFSGAGSTKAISEILVELLERQGCTVDLIELLPNTPASVLDDYDFFVIGTPTYNERPAQVVLDFIESLPRDKVTNKRAYVFATYGLYPINCQRIVAKKLQAKGVRPVGYSGVRSPASDGVLMFPSWLKFLFQYQASAPRVVNKMATDIAQLAGDETARTRIAPFKWYTPFDYVPNRLFTRKLFHVLYRPHFRVIADRWDGQPIDTSYPDAWQTKDGLPHYIDEVGRDFSLRCVHRTPNKAVIYKESMQDKPRLTPEFYEAHKRDILNKVQ